MRHSGALTIFQAYGVVTSGSKFSIFFATFAIALSLFTFWKTLSGGFFTIFTASTVSGKAHVFSFSLLHSIRLLVFISSFLNIRKFEEILDEFESFDSHFRRVFAIKACTTKKERFLALKVNLIIVSTLAPLCNIFNSEAKKQYLLLTATSAHILRVKELSFKFLVDCLNVRLEALLKRQARRNEVSRLHTKLWRISKLINESQSIVSLAVLQNCYGIIKSLFYVTLAASNLDHLVPIQREIKSLYC